MKLCVFLFLSWLSVLCAVRGEAVTLDSGHVRVIADGFSPSYAGKALQSAEQSIDTIASALEYTPQGVITIILTSTDRQFQELTGGQLPKWSAAVAIGDDRIVVTPLNGWKQDLDRVLRHELVHAVIEDAAGGQFVPRWFHEGVAQTLSGEWGIREQFVLVWRTMRHDLLTFDQIQNILSSGQVDAGLAYDQSLLAIRHLEKKNGDQAIPLILRGLHEGRSFAVAFQEGTGVWPSEFEQDYLSDVQQVYGRSFYLLIPSVWTFILILMVIVYVIKRRRNRALMRRWEVIEAAENIIQLDGHTSDPDPEDDSEPDTGSSAEDEPDRDI